MTYQEYCLDELGYETKTTYFMDFSIAERFGANAIKDTYKRALLNNDYIYLTELCMVLNHKCWFAYDRGNSALSKLYADLYYECRDYCLNNLKDDELKYFLRTTD